MAPEEDEPDDAVKEADADGAEVKKAPTSKKMTVSMEQFEALRHKVDKNEIDLIHKIGKLQSSLTMHVDKAEPMFDQHDTAI